MEIHVSQWEFEIWWNIYGHWLYDQTCNNILARTRDAIDNVRINNAFFLLKQCSFWRR